MSIKTNLKYSVEFVFAKVLTTVLAFLPLPVVSFLGFALGEILMTIPTGLLKKSIKQISFAFPEMPESEKKRIAKRSAVHMLQTFFETARVYSMSEKCFTKRLNVTGAERFEENKGAMLLTAHFGNWEALLRLMSVHKLPSAVIYRPANNPYVDTLITNMRAKTGIEAVAKGRAGARPLIQACKDGKYIGILNDQRLREGQPLTLFGKEAYTSTGFAELAVKFNRPMVPFFCRRVGFGKFDIEILPPLPMPEGTTEEKVLLLTQAYNDVLEAQVRRSPEQWMWQHSRFK